MFVFLEETKDQRARSYCNYLKCVRIILYFQLGMAPTILGARQLVNHGHIRVNDHMVDIPSYLCKPITIIDQQRLRTKNMDHPF
jgi:hypothetical protein